MAQQFYDEMYDARGKVRPHYKEFARWLAATPPEQLALRRREADLLFHRAGITFTLYGDDQGTERLRPFDTIPRSSPASEWRMVEQGCIQRVKVSRTGNLLKQTHDDLNRPLEIVYSTTRQGFAERIEEFHHYGSSLPHPEYRFAPQRQTQRPACRPQSALLAWQQRERS